MSRILLALLLAAGGKPPPAQASSPPQTDPDPSRAARGVAMQITGGSLLGVGAAGLGLALVFKGLENRALNEIANAAAPGPTGFPQVLWSDVRSIDDRARRMSIASSLLVPLSFLTLTAATTLLVVGTTRRRIQLAPSGIAGRF